MTRGTARWLTDLRDRYEAFLRIDNDTSLINRIRARSIYTLGLTFALIQVLNAVGLIIIYGQSRPAFWLAVVSIFVMIALTQCVRYIKAYQAFTILFTAYASAGVLFAINVIGNGIHNALMVFVVATPIYAAAISGPITSLVIGVYSIAFVFGIYHITPPQMENLGYPYGGMAEHRLTQSIYAAILVTAVSATLSASMYSALRRLENALKTAKEAEQSKSDFMAKTSHELRTPLNGVMGLSYALGETRLTDRQSELLKPLQASAAHMAEIVNDVVDLSRIDSGDITIEAAPFSPRGLMESLFAPMRMAADDKGLHIELHVAETVPDWVTGDETRIRQIASNLINNAIKFTEAGTITVWLTTASYGDRHLLTMRVIDTGSGIPLDRRDDIFDRYVQIHPDASTGTGLGLSISRELAHMMEGDVYVDATSPAGSTFVAEIMVDRYMPDTSRDRISDIRASLPLLGLRVLVIDDNERNLMVCQLLLEGLGAEAQGVSNGKAALGRLLTHPEQFQVVIVDKRMPDMDGPTVLDRIRERPELNSLKIVACTADAMAGEREKLLGLGFDDYLPKPIDPVELLDIMLKYFTPPARSESDVA